MAHENSLSLSLLDATSHPPAHAPLHAPSQPSHWSRPACELLEQGPDRITRAIRAHVRLIRIAPEIFDDTVVRRDAVQRAEREAFKAELNVVLEKVYGPTPPKELHQSQNESRCRNGAKTVQFSRQKAAPIEFHMAEFDLCMSAGRAAFARHQQLRPHRMLHLAHRTS